MAAELATDPQTGEEWKNDAGQGEDGIGVVTLADDGAGEVRVTRAHAKRRWNQVRRDARGRGATRRAAIAEANAVCATEYPQFSDEYPSGPVEIPDTSADIPDLADDPPAEPPVEPSQHHTEIPADWPTLPANASLSSEVQWVQANRLRVRDGERLDLTRALSPAPSHAALSWLETAINYPSKWADVTVKATSSQADDTEATRRERVAVDEIASLLDSTLEELGQ